MFDSDDQEILDLVDKNDQVVGTIKRGDASTLKNQSDRYIRAVELFIQRSNGDIYLPRRSTSKKTAPGGLDLSVAGHIFSGETYEQACIREIQEEAGIATTIDKLIFLTKILPSDTLYYFRNIYLFRTDVEPKLSEEHTEAIWISPREIADFVNNDVPTKDTLHEDITALLDFLRSEKV